MVISVKIVNETVTSSKEILVFSTARPPNRLVHPMPFPIIQNSNVRLRRLLDFYSRTVAFSQQERFPCNRCADRQPPGRIGQIIGTARAIDGDLTPPNLDLSLQDKIDDTRWLCAGRLDFNVSFQRKCE